MTKSTAVLRIQRFFGPGQASRVDSFEVPVSPAMTVMDGLRHIQKHPVTVEGQTVAVVVFEDACTPGPCGGCTMVLNGWPAQACCTPLVASSVTVVGPLPGFVVLGDLWVDRGALDGGAPHAQAALPWSVASTATRMAQATAAAMQQDLRCTGCGACQTVCPSVGPASRYVGPAVLHAAATWQRHPLAALAPEGNLGLAVGDGGVVGCGNAQNCARGCPQALAVPAGLARLSGVASRRWLGQVLGR